MLFGFLINASEPICPAQTSQKIEALRHLFHALEDTYVLFVCPFFLPSKIQLGSILTFVALQMKFRHLLLW